MQGHACRCSGHYIFGATEKHVGVCRLQRGTQEELCKTFFDIYDLNGDSKLQGDEIIQVYQHLLSSTSRTHMTEAQRAKVRFHHACCRVAHYLVDLRGPYAINDTEHGNHGVCAKLADNMPTVDPTSIYIAFVAMASAVGTENVPVFFTSTRLHLHKHICACHHQQ